MNKFKFFMMVAVAATVLTSCSKEPEVNNNGRVAVQFLSGNIADVQTRVSGTDWDGNEHIGIFMLKSDYSLVPANIIAENKEYAATSATSAAARTATFTPVVIANGGPDNTIYYPTSGDVKFIAYYPYSTSPSNGGQLLIDVSDQSSQSDIDVLYAPLGTAYRQASGTPVELSFEHKLVKLIFNVQNGTGVSADPTALTVKIDKQFVAGTLNLATGAVLANGSGAQEITAVNIANSATYEAIVLPAASNSGVTCSFTNNANETFTVDLNTITTSFAGNHEYTYTVTLNKNSVSASGKITAWTQEGPTAITATD